MTDSGHTPRTGSSLDFHFQKKISNTRFEKIPTNAGNGSGSKLRPEKWVFDEDNSSKKLRQGKLYGPYETVFKKKIDTFPKPYKEIVSPTSASLCLPSIKNDCFKTISQPNKLGPVYTRYTRSQQKRREAVKSIEDQIHKHVGLFNQFKDQVDPSRHRRLWAHLKNVSSKDIGREERQKAHEGLVKLLETGSDGISPDINASPSRESTMNLKNAKMNTEELETMIVEQKNLYIYHAKPPRPVREMSAGLIPKKKKKKQKNEEENLWGDHPEEIRLKMVLQEFLDWVFGLGGVNTIDEHTLRCLFSSGYDTTPTMSVPITLLKGLDIPQALRDASAVPPTSPSLASSQKTPIITSKKHPKKVTIKKKPFRFGAWYLNPQSWKKMRPGEKMADPKQLEAIKNKTGMQMKKRELAEDLAGMQITRAFHDFIRIKSARQPEFLTEAINIRKEQEAKNKEKAEAEERAKQEYLLKQIK